MSLLNCIPWFNKPVQPGPPKDHWEDCSDSFYVHDYRRPLDKLAEELQGDSGPKIYTRFNRESKAAEILTDRYGVLAAVNVHGSEGAPYRAVVSLNPFLKDGLLEEKFRAAFGKLSLEFHTMQ